MHTKKVATNAIVYTLANLVPQVISFALLPIFTRYLVPSDYAILNYTAAVSTYLLQLGILGFNTYLLRFYFVRKTDEERKNLIGTVAGFMFVATFIVHVAALLGSPWALRHFHVSIPYAPYFPLAIVSDFFDVFTILPFMLFRVKEQAGRFFIFSFSKILIRYSLSIFVLTVMKQGLIGKMWVDLLVNGVFFVVCAVIIFGEAGLRFSFSEMWEGLRFSIPFFLSGVLFLLVDNSDRFFLERTVTLTTLGLFSIAATIATAFSGFVVSVYKAVEPSVYRGYEGDQFFQQFAKLRKYYFTVIIGLAFSLTLFISEIVTLITGRNFHRAAPIVPPLVLAVVIQSISILYDMILMAQKRARLILGVHIIGAAAILGLNSLLVPLMGVWGAALSKNISYLAMGLMSAFFAKRIMGEVGILQEWRIIGLALVSGVVIYLLDYLFNPQSQAILFLCKLAALVGMGGVIILVMDIPVAKVLGIKQRLQGVAK